MRHMACTITILAALLFAGCGVNLSREAPEEKAFKEKAAEFAKQGRALITIMKSDSTSFNDYARNLDQLNDSLDAVHKLTFTDAELKEIDRHAVEGAIDLWKGAREGTE